VTVVDSGLTYRSDEPVLVRVVHREHRYDLDDDGAAVQLAGKRSGWFEAANRIVVREALNINRRGVVFVPAVDGRDIDALAQRVAETSRQVYLTLLEL
jgi:hypothetical protein